MKKLRDTFTEMINGINDAPLSAADWVVLAAMSAFMLVTMLYPDIIIIYHHSLTFWDSVFSGDMGNFYANTLASPSYGFGAVYYWIVYLVIGIWNLPVWVLSRYFNVNAYSIKCLIYCRLEIVLFFILTLYMIEQLLKDRGYGKDRCRLAQFIFASSLMVVLPVMDLSQIDIIIVFLMLLGIREYVRSETLTWKFLLIFSFAACMKIFALFVFIPLVLLREKRILHAIWDLFVGTWFILICRLPYMGRADYIESTSILNDVMIERMFTVTLPTGNTVTPIFLALLIAICIWAYIKKPEGAGQRFYYAMWTSLAIFASFFAFIFAHPYWIVLMAPYMAILIIVNVDLIKINMILEFCAGLAATVYYSVQFGTYLTSDTFSYLILPRLGLELKSRTSAVGLFTLANNDEKMAMYFTVFFAAFVVCMAAFLYINRPGICEMAAVDSSATMPPYAWASSDTTATAPLRYDHGMLILRLVVIFAYIAGCIYYGYIY